MGYAPLTVDQIAVGERLVLVSRMKPMALVLQEATKSSGSTRMLRKGRETTVTRKLCVTLIDLALTAAALVSVTLT